ncbi:SGNH/GDSL hydrolase family protein [Mycobacterium sp. LTG2003]
MTGCSSGEMMRVVCLGDSITRDRLKPDHVCLLQNRAGTQVTYTRMGADDGFAHHLARYLDAVVAQQPDIITVLAGTGDGRAGLSPTTARTMRQQHNLPTLPTIDWFAENLDAIVTRLVGETGARIALLSLPVLGLNLDVPPVLPFGRYSQVIRETAIAHGVSYVPVYERQVQHMIGTIHAKCAGPSDLHRAPEWSARAAYHTSHGEAIIAGLIEHIVTTHSRGQWLEKRS